MVVHFRHQRIALGALSAFFPVVLGVISMRLGLGLAVVGVVLAEIDGLIGRLLPDTEGRVRFTEKVECATMCYMRYGRGEVGVRELRQNLSVYLKRVKAGESLEVKERGHRVAVLTPVTAKASVLERLVAAGRATASRKDLLALGPPPGRRPSRRASRAVARLRDERA